VFSQIDLARAFIYFVIDTPHTLLIKEQKMLKITAINKYGCVVTSPKYTSGR